MVLFSSLLFSQQLEQGLAYKRQSINLCLVNELMNERGKYKWHGFIRMQFGKSTKSLSIPFIDLSKLHNHKDIYLNILKKKKT